MRPVQRLRDAGVRELTAPVQLLLWAVWIVFIVETLARGSWGEAIRWTFDSFRLFGLNALAALALLLLMSAVTASIRLPLLLVSATCLTFGLLCGTNRSG